MRESTILQSAFLLSMEQSDPDGTDATWLGPNANSLHPGLNLRLKTRWQITVLDTPETVYLKRGKVCIVLPQPLPWACMKKFRWSSQRYEEDKIYILAGFLWIYSSSMAFAAAMPQPLKERAQMCMCKKKEKWDCTLPLQIYKYAPSSGGHQEFLQHISDRLPSTAHL